MKQIIIGIGGVARSGKDTMCQLIIEALSKVGVKAKRRALADELKNDIRQSLIDKYGIDVWNCTPEQKEVIRPDLVAYGKDKRLTSEGTYWTSIVESKVGEEDSDYQVVIVPDVRYCKYPKDEVEWVKGNENGLLIHVTRFTQDENGQRQYIQPPNEDEAENDPKVKARADLPVTWKTLPPEELKTEFSGFFDIVTALVLNAINRAERRTVSS